MTTSANGVSQAMPEYAPTPSTSFGPALNDHGYHVGWVEKNLFWVTDGTYQSAPTPLQPDSDADEGGTTIPSDLTGGPS